MNGVLGYFRPVGFGRKGSQPPRLDVLFQARLQVATHRRDIVGANTNAGFVVPVSRHRPVGLLVSPPPCPGRHAFELLASHVAEDFVIDLGDERTRARELSGSLEPLLGDAPLELHR